MIDSANFRYHVPRSWLRSTGNVLVLFEELGGNPSQITLLTRSIEAVCAKVLESYPSPVDSWESNMKNTAKPGKPELRLNCAQGQLISSIKFAGFGTPEGQCGSFQHGECKAEETLQIVQKACIGRQSCSVSVSVDKLEDPCPGVDKSLAVEAVCN
eukprot:Gb_00911 [translate_table: standard]